MINRRLALSITVIMFIVILLIAIRPSAVGYAEPLADPTATMVETDKPPDPTPGPGVTETLEPTKTPPSIETTKPPDPTPPPGVTETLQPTKTDEPAITETASPAPSATNTETVQSSETPSQTPTVGDTATSTDTAVVSLTPTSTQTPVSSLTPSPTNTPPATSTSTNTATASHTPNIPTVTATATVLPSVTPGTPAATGTPTPTNTPVPVDTATNTPVTPVIDITPMVTNITGTVKVNAEGSGESANAYIVGLITFKSSGRRVPIGLGWLQGDRSFHHALNVAGRISDNDFGIHQKFMPELARLKPGAIVWIDDSKYQVQNVVKVVNKNQSVMDRLLAHWTTITTCTADWRSNLVFLLKPIDERMR